MRDAARRAPRVSLVMVARDNADLLPEALERVRAQKLEAWECLVVDDGSTDATTEVAAAWAEGDDRFRSLSQEGAGWAAAGNLGIDEARGAYVAVLDPRDLLTPDALVWQVAALDGDAEAVLVYGDAARLQAGAGSRGDGAGATPGGTPCGDAFEELLGPPAIHAPVARLEAVRRAGGLDPSLTSAVAWDLWLRLARTGPVLHRPRVTVERREGPAGEASGTLADYRGARAVLARHLPAVPSSRRGRRRREALARIRSTFVPGLREEALRLESEGCWSEARLRWRALAALAPGRLRSGSDLARVAWSFLPTGRAPSLGGAGWAVRRLTSRRVRHRGGAELRSRVRRIAWRARAQWSRPRHGGSGEPALVGIALVDHMGDLVAAEPVARHLRARHPDARLVWVVRQAFRDLPEAYPEVDEVWTVSCLTEWIRLRGHAPFDRLVDLHLPGRSCGVCQVPLRRDDGDPEVHLDSYYGQGDLLEAFCRTAGLPVLHEGPRLRPPEAARRAVDGLALPEAYVCIHGRSSQASRDWRDDGWRALAPRVTRETGLPVVEVGLEPVLSPAPERIDLCGSLSILETAEVLRRARLFVGIDSGPAHLAHAVGTPGVLLMGRYRHWDRYRPWAGGYGSGETAEVLWADGPASTLPVDRVAAAVVGALDRAGTGQAVPEGGRR